MSEIERVSILGVGLIGGSLGRAWQTHRPELTVVGYDRPEVLRRSREAEAVDEVAGSPHEAVETADVVVLAPPLDAIPDLLEEIAPHLRPGTLVSDVGSVKGPITRHAARVLPPSVLFVGGHPMAGAEESGIDHADAFLFENATYVLCPPHGEDTDTLANRRPELIELIEATGARVRIMDAGRHDRIAARVSHLPQLVAVTLMNTALDEEERDEAVLQLAAGGFRDMTRIASSPFDLWSEILNANRGPALEAVDALIHRLNEVRDILDDGLADRLEPSFRRAKEARERIPRDTKGFLQPLFDIYVYAEDRPGFLAHLTGLLSEAEINIKDIELLKIREGTGGAFRMGFSSDEDAERAVETLREGGHRAYRL